MRVFTLSAVLTASLLAIGAVPALAQVGTTSLGSTFRIDLMVQPSAMHRSVAVALEDARAAMDAKKWPEAAMALQQAQAGASNTSDKLRVYQLLATIDMALGDGEDAAIAAETAAELPNIPPEERQDIYANAAAMAFNAGHGDKAVKYARALQALAPTDSDSRHIIASILAAQSTAAK